MTSDSTDHPQHGRDLVRDAAPMTMGCDHCGATASTLVLAEVRAFFDVHPYACRADV